MICLGFAMGSVASAVATTLLGVGLKPRKQYPDTPTCATCAWMTFFACAVSTVPSEVTCAKARALPCGPGAPGAPGSPGAPGLPVGPGRPRGPVAPLSAVSTFGLIC